MGFPPSPRLLRKLREQAAVRREVRGQRSEVRCQRSGVRVRCRSPFSMRLPTIWALGGGLRLRRAYSPTWKLYELEAGSERRLLLISDL